MTSAALAEAEAGAPLPASPALAPTAEPVGFRVVVVVVAEASQPEQRERRPARVLSGPTLAQSLPCSFRQLVRLRVCGIGYMLILNSVPHY